MGAGGSGRDALNTRGGMHGSPHPNPAIAFPAGRNPANASRAGRGARLQGIPIDQFPPRTVDETEFTIAWLYESLATQWARWLPEAATQEVRRAGNFDVLLEPVRSSFGGVKARTREGGD